MDETTTSDETQAAPADDAALREAGKRALSAERSRADKAEKALKQAQEQLAQHTATVDELRGQLDQTTATAKQQLSQAQTELQGKLKSALIRSIAANQFADPTDVNRYVDVGQFELDDSYQLDETKVQAAIADVLKARPYLQAKNAPTFFPADSGPRPTARPDVRPGLGRLQVAFAETA